MTEYADKHSSNRFVESPAAAAPAGSTDESVNDLWAPLQMKEDPKAPAGLGPRATPDLRFLICYFPSVPQSARVMTRFFHALAQRDLKMMADSLHFPFASWEGTERVVINTPEELIAKAPPSLNISMDPARFTDHDGYMKPGSYDVFGGMEFITSDPIQSVLSMYYDRYDKNGQRMLRCQGIYGVTNNDGKWAIQQMSTIFTPSQMIGTIYSDTITAAKRLRINHDLAYQIRDNDGVWGRVRPAIWQPEGASSATPYSSNGAPSAQRTRQDSHGVPWQDAPKGNEFLMEHFRFKGVKSRIGPGTQQQPYPPASPSGPGEWVDPKAKIDFAQTIKTVSMAGVGNWGFPTGILPYTRVLHNTENKAHLYSGVTRYNVWGEEISNSVEVAIITYVLGRWSWAGSLGYICNHDRANDVHS